jgi:serine/threonine protein kinase
VIGGYQVLNVVATGQTSQIFEAVQEGGGRRVALKMLLRERAKESEHVAFLRHEATVAKQLEHPNIITVLDFQRNRKSPDGPYMVMEYFPAPNLKQVIRRDHDAVKRQAHRIITQIAQGMAYAHDKRWVHRDLKPDNILVNKSGEVRVIDFALAVRIQGALGRMITPKPKIQGTRSYMSPEQIQPKRGPLDGRSDIYALGIVIFEMLSGKTPFHANSPDELLLRHLRSPAPSLITMEIDVTPEMDNLIQRMLAKKPQERPENLHSFLAEFRKMRIMQNDPVPQANPMGGF